MMLRFLACSYVGATPFTETVNRGGGGGLRRWVEENNSILDISEFEMPGSCPDGDTQ